jgi:hypothetical protein
VVVLVVALQEVDPPVLALLVKEIMVALEIMMAVAVAVLVQLAVTWFLELEPVMAARDLHQVFQVPQ